MVGFWRTGSLFASQRGKLSPDLMCLSKGLTGGFLPMGITMASQKIFDVFLDSNPRKTFWHGHSFTANPLGCAAANASLDLLEDNPNSYLNFESRHSPHLKQLAMHPKVKKVRLAGTIAAFELNTNEEAGYLNITGKAIKKYALSHNVFIRPLGIVIYLLAPLCITDEQLTHCYTTLQNGLDIIP